MSDRSGDSHSSEMNKPDFRELDFGSPIFPLRTRASTSSATIPSSSSFSFRSIFGRNIPDHLPRQSISGKSSHSGKLPSSAVGSGKAYSGGRSLANTPAMNVFPAGNICQSGRMLKTGNIIAPTRTDVLGSGTDNYGYGSIVRGGGVTSSRREIISKEGPVFRGFEGPVFRGFETL